jgi:hypothetical protein
MKVIIPEPDTRSDERKALDEQLAAAPPIPFREMPPSAKGVPVEVLLARRVRRPVAVAGVVENGLVRPLDPDIKLPERSRVIIVAAGS